MNGWEFRVAGIPVQLSLFFFLVAVIIGQGQYGRSLPLAVAWVAVVFVGVLVHELGHALTARAFGQRPVISFHAFGGLTSWSPTGEIGAGKRLLISAAGPVVGIAVGSLAALVKLGMAEGTVPRIVLGYAVWVNLGWGVLNLLPILPLDGGKIMGSFFDLLAPQKGMRAAHIVSIVLAVALGLLGLSVGAIAVVVFCALFAFINIQALRPPVAEEAPPGPDSPGGQGGPPDATRGPDDRPASRS